MTNLMNMLADSFQSITGAFASEWGVDKVKVKLEVPKPIFVRLKYDFERAKKGTNPFPMLINHDFMQTEMSIFTPNGIIKIKGSNDLPLENTEQKDEKA